MPAIIRADLYIDRPAAPSHTTNMVQGLPCPTHKKRPIHKLIWPRPHKNSAQHRLVATPATRNPHHSTTAPQHQQWQKQRSQVRFFGSNNQKSVTWHKKLLPCAAANRLVTKIVCLAWQKTVRLPPLLQPAWQSAPAFCEVHHIFHPSRRKPATWHGTCIYIGSS